MPIKPKVLHVVSDSFGDSVHLHSGGSKGILIFHQYLLDRNIEHDQIAVRDRSDQELRKILSEYDLNNYRIILIHYSIYPKSIAYIKRRYPKVHVMVRAHNAEFLHWQDHALGWLLHGNPILALKHLIRAFQKLYQDWLCSLRADSVLAITQWEIDNYWSYMTSSKKIFYVPYHSPVNVIESSIVNSVTRENILICMLAKNVSSSSLLIDAREKFVSLVKKIGAGLPKWRFVITGPVNGEQVVESRIEWVGFVEDIGHILQRAKAVAVLSNLGFGFKTKIIEAIEFGCIVLVQEALYKRLPDELRSSCMIVDISDISSITHALNNIDLYQDFGGNGVIMNNKFKIQMYSKLDEFFISRGKIN